MVRLRASSSAVAWEPGCVSPPTLRRFHRQRPLRLDVAASAWDPDPESEISDFRSKSTSTSPGRLLCSSSDACAILHVRRQAEPSASREVLVPYSVRQPRCAFVLSGAASTRTRSRFGVGIPARVSITDVRLGDRTLARAVLRSALATRLTSDRSVSLRIPLEPSKRVMHRVSTFFVDAMFRYPSGCRGPADRSAAIDGAHGVLPFAVLLLPARLWILVGSA
jgi:hypothetical protein